MIKKLVFLFSILVLFPSASFAGRLEKLKDGYGWVVIAIDDASPPLYEKKLFGDIQALWMFHGLKVTKFDPVTKTIMYNNPDKRSQDEVEFFELEDKSNKKRYWIGQIKESYAAISMFHKRSLWGLCLNNETKYFYVKKGEFNLIGSFDATQSFALMSDAIKRGDLPESLYTTSFMIVDSNYKLQGFIANNDIPKIQSDADEFLSKYLKVSVSTILPEILSTEFNKEIIQNGDTQCFKRKK